jgi:hypothetical protein
VNRLRANAVSRLVLKVPANEDDRAEIGKGHEFPTQLFYEISKYAAGLIFDVLEVPGQDSGPQKNQNPPERASSGPV